MTSRKKDSTLSDKWIEAFRQALDEIVGGESELKLGEPIEKTILFLTKGESEVPESLREVISYDRDRQALRIHDVLFKIQVSSAKPTFWPKGNRAVVVTLDALDNPALIRAVVTLDESMGFEANLLEVASTARIPTSSQETNRQMESGGGYQVVIPKLVTDLDDPGDSSGEEAEE